MIVKRLYTGQFLGAELWSGWSWQSREKAVNAEYACAAPGPAAVRCRVRRVQLRASLGKTLGPRTSGRAAVRRRRRCCLNSVAGTPRAHSKRARRSRSTAWWQGPRCRRRRWQAVRAVEQAPTNLTIRLKMPAVRRDSGNIPFDFFNTEIDLALTFVQVAEVERSDDPEHAPVVLAKARAARKTVKDFLSKPLPGLDAERAKILQGRCRSLKAAIEQVGAQP